MVTIASGGLIALASLLVLPAVVLFVEVIAAGFFRHQIGEKQRDLRLRVSVIVPAHNEGVELIPTIADIKLQLAPSDRLLVVADNCEDNTAEVARGAGAEVTIRNDFTRIGKGYALDCGLRYLADWPEIVIIIDADCRLRPGAIDQLATSCAATRRPIQALYLMDAPEQTEINHRVAMFAWRVKNYVRPLGLKTLHGPCQLMGTGMAFPIDVLGRVNLASGHQVEDLRLGLDLALAGAPPLFCPSAIITSRFPSTAKGSHSQRQRWERGHLSVIAADGLPFFFQSVRLAKLQLLILTVDMMVPPLTLLGLALTGTTILTGFAAMFGLAPAAFSVSMVGLSLFAGATLFCWMKHGRDVLPATALLSIVPYVLEKRRLCAKLTPSWVRTERSTHHPPKPQD